MGRGKMILTVKTRKIKVSNIEERSEFRVQDGRQLDPGNLSWRLMVERLGLVFGGQEF